MPVRCLFGSGSVRFRCLFGKCRFIEEMREKAGVDTDQGSKRKGGKISVQFHIVSDKFLIIIDYILTYFLFFYHIFYSASAAVCAS